VRALSKSRRLGASFFLVTERWLLESDANRRRAREIDFSLAEMRDPQQTVLAFGGDANRKRAREGDVSRDETSEDGDAGGGTAPLGEGDTEGGYTGGECDTGGGTVQPRGTDDAGDETESDEAEGNETGSLDTIASIRAFPSLHTQSSVHATPSLHTESSTCTPASLHNTASVLLNEFPIHTTPSLHTDSSVHTAADTPPAENAVRASPAAAQPLKTWACEMCTLINPLQHLQFAVCQAERRYRFAADDRANSAVSIRPPTATTVAAAAAATTATTATTAAVALADTTPAARAISHAIAHAAASAASGDGGHGDCGGGEVWGGDGAASGRSPLRDTVWASRDTGERLAFIRLCFTSKLNCGRPSSFYCHPQLQSLPYCNIIVRPLLNTRPFHRAPLLIPNPMQYW